MSRHAEHVRKIEQELWDEISNEIQAHLDDLRMRGQFHISPGDVAHETAKGMRMVALRHGLEWTPRPEGRGVHMPTPDERRR